MGIHQALLATSQIPLSITSLASFISTSALNNYDFDVTISSVGSNDLVVVAMQMEIDYFDNSQRVITIEPRLGSAQGTLVSYTEAVGNFTSGTFNFRSRAGIVVIDGANLSGSTLNYEVDFPAGVSFTRYAARAYKVSGRSTINTDSTYQTTSVSATENLSHTISTTAGDVSVTSAYFADGQNHTLSGHQTVQAGCNNSAGSGDFGISSNLTQNTAITYTRNADTNTQGHIMVSAVFR